MGRTSKRENKTIYQLCREQLGWSRAKASEATHISENRIEKIELEKTPAIPLDIVSMSTAYNAPELCNYYCVHECAIGKELKVSEIEKKGLAKIVLEVLTTMNLLEAEKNRLIEIAADEEITDDELNDFIRIKDQLEKISNTVESLKLWISNSITEGKLNKSLLSEHVAK